MNFDQTFENKNIKVEFVENLDFAVNKLKKGEDYFLALNIFVVNKDGEKLSQYFRNFEKQVSPQHYNSFVKKFLNNKEYRKSFLLTNELNWEGTILLENTNNVNEQCAKLIEKINNQDKLKFKDFSQLKTFGIDKFSRMNEEKLNSYVKPFEKEWIEKELAEEKLILTAMRWRARGLKVQHSIRKVKTDLEIQNNLK